MKPGIAVLIGMTFYNLLLPAQAADEWIKLGEENNCSFYLKRIDYSGRYRNIEHKLIGKGCNSADGAVVLYRADCEKWSTQAWESVPKKWRESEVSAPGTNGDDWMKLICGQ
jgi:hypothetical protein